jgi:hypothetical protein
VVSLADLDGDGDLDAFVGNGHTDDTGSPNTIWLNEGTGRFADSGQRLGQRFEHSVAVALGDLDDDGDLDAIFGNESSADTVWLNDGKGRFRKHGEYWMKPGSRGYPISKALVLGDLDGDADLDAFVGNCCRGEYGIGGSPGREPTRLGYSDSYNAVWLNDGGGRFTDSGQLLGNEATLAIALGDVDGDGDLDAFVGNEYEGSWAVGSPANEVWLNDGSGRFSDSGQDLGRGNSYAVALGDLDGDGDLDAFVGNRDPRTFSRADKVWLNDGTGYFTDSGQDLGDADTRVVALVDLDGDGDLDAFVDNDAASQIWRNDGTGRFLDSGQHLSHDSGYVANVGDVDGDGDTDVFATHYDKGYQVWYNDGSGYFGQERSRTIIPICLATGGVIVLGLCLLGWWIIRRRYREEIR